MDGVGGELLAADEGGSVIGDGGCPEDGACEENESAKEWDGESGGCVPGPVAGG